MKKNFNVPKIEKKSEAEIDEIIVAINATNLSESIKVFIINCIRLACWFPSVLQTQQITLRKLKEMIFGKNKKRKKSNSNGGNSSSTNEESGDDGGSSSSNNQGDATGAANNASNTPPKKGKKKRESKSKNNGRNPHIAYPNAQIIWHRVENLNAGSPCPEALCTGKLSTLPAGVIVVFDGQPMVNVSKHFYEKYRCNLCGKRVEANTPSELEGKQRVYTPEFRAYLAMHKFFLAVPYHRMDTYQNILNCPLPDATQWDIIDKLAGFCYRVFDVYKLHAANSKIIWNDDTVNRILDIIAENKQGGKKRTGMFTTCIMAQTEDGHKIALYLNGTKHSGENVETILDKRDKDKGPVIQMSDAMPVNTPATIATIACYCLSHGFRKIEYLDEYFPLPCMSIMKKLGKVFTNDAKTKGMTDDERLAYHVEHSKPIMFALYQQIVDLLSSNDVEPNGDLAKALRYFQNNWVELTRFLSVPGAPICNNIVERALKLAIRVRKNSLFYKSCYSASISGMITSLIYTCIYSDVNPITYLTALQEHHESVLLHPEKWMPWNFHEQLTRLTPDVPEHARVLATSPPLANLAEGQFEAGLHSG